MSIHITTTHTVTCENAPVEDVYRELDEQFPQLNPLIEQKLQLREERDDARNANQTLLASNSALKLKVVELTRERDEIQKRLEESWAIKEKLIAESEKLAEDFDNARIHGKLTSSRPALPEGMRIAEHEEYGRVLVSPYTASDMYYRIFALDDETPYRADCFYTKPSALTFLDEEPAPAPLPKPEDCKPGEFYLAKVFDRDVVAKRCDIPDDQCSWIAYWIDDCYSDYCSNSQITLLARLLPDRDIKEQA